MTWILKAEESCLRAVFPPWLLSWKTFGNYSKFCLEFRGVTSRIFTHIVLCPPSMMPSCTINLPWSVAMKPRLLPMGVVKRNSWAFHVLNSGINFPLLPTSAGISGVLLGLFSPSLPKTVLPLDAERSIEPPLYNTSPKILDIFGIGLTPSSFSCLGYRFLIYSFGHLLRDLKGGSRIQTTECYHLTKKCSLWLFEVKQCGQVLWLSNFDVHRN